MSIYEWQTGSDLGDKLNIDRRTISSAAAGNHLANGYPIEITPVTLELRAALDLHPSTKNLYRVPKDYEQIVDALYTEAPAAADAEPESYDDLLADLAGSEATIETLEAEIARLKKGNEREVALEKENAALHKALMQKKEEVARKDARYQQTYTEVNDALSGLLQKVTGDPMEDRSMYDKIAALEEAPLYQDALPDIPLLKEVLIEKGEMAPTATANDVVALAVEALEAAEDKIDLLEDALSNGVFGKRNDAVEEELESFTRMAPLVDAYIDALGFKRSDAAAPLNERIIYILSLITADRDQWVDRAKKAENKAHRAIALSKAKEGYLASKEICYGEDGD